MGGEWQTLTVDQIKAQDNRAIAIGPFGSRMKADTYVASGVPVIRGNNISDTRVFVDEFVYVSEQTADELRACNVFAGDLVFPHRGAIGQVGIIPATETPRFMLSTSLMKLTCNKEIVDPLFIFYFFRSTLGRHALLQHASTVGTPGIGQPLTSLRSIRLPIPPIPEQRAIAHILGTLDDKIELNRRRNQTLEAMARALFKDWFVDFGPVRAKMEGRARQDGARSGQPRTPQASDLPWPGAEAGAGAQGEPYLPADLWQLFPDCLDDEGKPEGWSERPLGDFVDIYDSRRVPLSGKLRAERQGPYPYHGAAGVMDGVDDFLFDGVHVLLGEDGSVVKPNGRPYTQYVWGKFWVNNHAHVLRGRGISNETLLVFLDQCDVAPFVTGAVQPKLSQGSLKAIPFSNAGDALLRRFGEIVDPLFAQIRGATEDSRTLALLRDTLLPKLISGELRIQDAEQFIEAAQ